MPGIVGLVAALAREEGERKLLRMVEALDHERFYVSGIWIDESLGVYAGWVARKNSFSDGMPLRNEHGDLSLVFSGEEYPEPGTQQRLKAQGHDLRLDGPSYLVHLAEEDPAFPAKLNGRFHGLLIDKNRGTVTLFNDRWGIHRLYYHESKDAIYFAAEAKAILAVCPELRILESQSLGEFISCGCTLENRSLFNGLQILPGGSKWEFRNRALTQKLSYFEPSEWENQEMLAPQQYSAEFCEVFTRNLPRYFSGEERIAMSLTGGLDTRMIMASQNSAPGDLPCFTFGGMRRECQDVIMARKVAQMCGQPYQVIRTEQDFLTGFSYFAERAVFLSDGCCDVSRAPDVYWNAKARDIAPVRMTGNYGGELFRGVRTFKPVEPMRGLFVPELYSHIHRTAETYSRHLQGNPISFSLAKQAPWNHFGLLALEESQIALRSPFWDNELVKTVYRAPKSELNVDNVSIPLIAQGNSSLLRIRTDRGLLGEGGKIMQGASRAVLEFLFKAEYAYDMGMPQSLARVDHSLRRLHLERLFLGRHKISHFRIWYRDALAVYVRDTLLDPRSLSRPYINRKGLEDVVESHLKGGRNHTTEIHKLLTLELLHRLFIDNSGRSGFGVTSSAPLAAVAS
jgi:asparagine synthase (glutamine-hydrolysing)